VAIVDRYAEQARAGFLRDIEAGTSLRVREPRDDLDGRSLHGAWAAGDREAVERWMESEYARTEAIVAAHRADPDYMARIMERQQPSGRTAGRAIRSV